MGTHDHTSGPQTPTEHSVIVRTITVIMGTVVGLTFLFGFGDVLNLALRLGVPVWVAPLVAPQSIFRSSASCWVRGTSRSLVPPWTCCARPGGC